MNIKEVADKRYNTIVSMTNYLKGIDLDKKIEALKENGVEWIREIDDDFTDGFIEEILRDAINLLKVKIVSAENEIRRIEADQVNIKETRELFASTRKSSQQKYLSSKEQKNNERIEHLKHKYNPQIKPLTYNFFTEIYRGSDFEGIKDRLIQLNESDYVIIEYDGYDLKPQLFFNSIHDCLSKETKKI